MHSAKHVVAPAASRRWDLPLVTRPLPELGITTAYLREQYGPLPVARPSRVAVVGCCVREHFPFDLACSCYRTACELLGGWTAPAQWELVTADEPQEDPRQLVAFLNRALADGLAGVVLLHASYTAGEVGAHVGRWLAEHETPVLSWSFPDPAAERLQANSLCCQNFLLNMWRRLGVRYAWLHQAIDAGAQAPLERFLRSIRARDRLRHARVLHAGGSRVTAFYDGETDELAVMRRFGLQFDRIDLETVYAVAREFPDDEVRPLADLLLKHPQCSVVDVPEAQVLQTLRFGLAIYRLAQQHEYVGCTVKSWPDLFNCYGCAIDGAVSMLNDAGLCTAEEGEMNGLLSSLALYMLSEGAACPTMLDLSQVDAAANRLGFWHCGACPTRTLKQGSTFAARKHSILENGDPATAVGLMLEFLLETGPATVVRYQSPDAARSFSFEGTLHDAALPFRGAYGLLEPTTASAASILAAALGGGLDHHWSLGYGHWQADLQLLNHWCDVADVPLVSADDDAQCGLSL